jgi:hypothetical protein
MAKEKKQKPRRENRLKQVWQVYTMTSRRDKSVTPILLALLIVPAAVGVVVPLLLEQPWYFVALWAASGLMAGVLVGLIVLGQKAQYVAYADIEGRPGAVGAMIRTSLRRGWIGTETPVAVNPKTQEAVYRVVGRGGVALLAEGNRERSTRLAEDEKRKLARVLPNVPISILSIGAEEGRVRLYRTGSALSRIKPVLTRAEVRIVNGRVSSLSQGMPIPKGIDPMRVRASHRR